MSADKPWLLLCEDMTEEVADPLKEWLEPHYNVAHGATREQCFELLTRSTEDPSERYAVAVIDLSFGPSELPPNVVGFEILAKVKEYDEFLIPIIYTGTGNAEKAGEAMRLGAYRLVTKSQIHRDAAKESWPLSELGVAIADAIALRKSLIRLYSTLAKLKKKYPNETELHDLVSGAYEYLQRVRGMKP
jgi:CheY-like chemotaxis protein